MSLTPRKVALIATLAGIPIGCGRGVDRSALDPHDSPAAEQAMRAYLEHAQVADTAPVPDSLQACEAYGSGDPQLALATFRVLSSTLSRDTVTVRAEIMSAATVRLAPDGPYEVRQGVRVDTLSWSLVHQAGTDQWAVCGYSRDGVGFVRLQYLGPAARWLNGASLSGVIALADSLRR